MKILVLEDDTEQLTLLAEELRRGVARATVSCATTRDSALELLSVESFDIAVIDLSIPSAAGAMDQDVSFGLQILAELEGDHPGTIRVARTALGKQSLVDPLYERCSRENYFGSGLIPMFKHRPKGEPGSIEELLQLGKSFEALRSVSIGDAEFLASLPETDAFMIRSFAKGHNAVTVNGSILTGGKSGARAYRLRLYDANSRELQAVVCKCDSWRKIEEEQRRFNTLVRNRMQNGYYAPIVNDRPLVSRNQAALFYGLASSTSIDLFEYLKGSHSTTELVQTLVFSRSNWESGKVSKRVSVREIRQLMISDEKFGYIRHLLPADIDRFEISELQVLIAVQHGDFHPGNLLVAESGAPLVIDVARAGDYSVCLDPLTLELWIALNVYADTGWPSEASIAEFMVPSKYFEGAPYREFLGAMRAWSEGLTESVGPRALCVTAYAYLVRQLQYDDVDQRLALAIIEALIHWFFNS